MAKKSDQTRRFSLNWRYVVSACLLSLGIMSAVFAWQQIDSNPATVAIAAGLGAEI